MSITGHRGVMFLRQVSVDFLLILAPRYRTVVMSAIFELQGKVCWHSWTYHIPVLRLFLVATRTRWKVLKGDELAWSWACALAKPRCAG